jgi:hypothetical protein
MKIFLEALIFPDNDFLSFFRSLLLRKSLPRLGKLAKSEGFKAKAALLVLTGSIIGAGGASSRGVLDWLVPCVVEFLTSEDWAIKASPAVGLTTVGHHLKLPFRDCWESTKSPLLPYSAEPRDPTHTINKKLFCNQILQQPNQKLQ